jgi:hypothetical protein
MKVTVVWIVAPCRLVEVYRRFRGACCFTARITEPGSTSQTSVTSIMLHGATTQTTHSELFLVYFMTDNTASNDMGNVLQEGSVAPSAVLSQPLTGGNEEKHKTHSG